MHAQTLIILAKIRDIGKIRIKLEVDKCPPKNFMRKS